MTVHQFIIKEYIFLHVVQVFRLLFSDSSKKNHESFYLGF